MYRAGLFAALLLLAACDEKKTGPIMVSAIGGPPALRNPNLEPLDPPAAILSDALAQGLVRFEASGQIEPALAQRWIVSDDGLRYTFRLARARWSGGGRVTAEQVAARVRSAASPASRNPLKHVLGAIDEVEAMTDDVLEITLKSPRPNFLQMLSQPQMSIVRNGQGTGPYVVTARDGDSITLRRPADEPEEGEWVGPTLRLRGEAAALAIVRFRSGGADLVTGGTAGDLPVARAAGLPPQSLRFDPVAGLFGLAFARTDGYLDRSDIRAALSMAIHRSAIVAAMGVPELQPRTSLVPGGIEELPAPSTPNWSGAALPARQAAAARTIAGATGGEGLKLTIAIPDEPGYRIIVSRLRRDWAAIGVQLEPVAEGRSADLRFVDSVAPSALASWYLRSFSCVMSPVCSVEADEALDRARNSPTAGERRQFLAQADRIQTEAAVFIPLAAPIRWHLVSDRLTGFRANIFGRHALGELIAETR